MMPYTVLFYIVAMLAFCFATLTVLSATFSAFGPSGIVCAWLSLTVFTVHYLRTRKKINSFFLGAPFFAPLLLFPHLNAPQIVLLFAACFFALYLTYRMLPNLSYYGALDAFRRTNYLLIGLLVLAVTAEKLPALNGVAGVYVLVYLAAHSLALRLLRSGHLGLRWLLYNPYVDFIVSPYSYGFRGIGGESAPMPPTESVRLHGKLYILEEDTRTHLSHQDPDYGRLNTLREAEAVLRRNLAWAVTHGSGIWWCGGGPGSKHINPEEEPAFRPLLRRFQEIGTFALGLDRAPCAEIAVLLDDESFFYESARNDLDLPLIFQQRLWGLPRIGAPYDAYLLEDFLYGRLPPYKLYIFLNPFHLDRFRREALARELRRDGRVALWIYAPGYIREEPSLAHMEELTGFRFAKGSNPWGPLMHLTDFTHPITQGLNQELYWGTNNRLDPIFHLDDPEAVVLGQVVYSLGRCKPGMGVKVFPQWTSIYIAAPNVPAPVLRGIARYAGVHLYSEAGDVLYATRQLLAVHTVSGGERLFRLPRKAEVIYELFTAQLIAREADAFRVTLAPASTALYYTGEAGRLGL